MSNYRNRVLLPVCLAFLLSAASFGADRVRRDDGAYKKDVKCTGALPGGTKAFEIAANPTKAGDIPNLIDTCRWQFGETIPWKKPPNNKRPADKQWTFKAGDLLKGTWVIDVYAAEDYEEGKFCIHGAHLSARYLKHPDDPKNLDFIQIVKNGREQPGKPAGNWAVDPYPDNGRDDAPYYFNDTQNTNAIRDEKFRHPDAQGKPGVLFGDSPGAAFAEAAIHSIKMEFWLALASWEDATPKFVTVHEGLYWGFEGQCGAVPEPASWLALAIGTLALKRRPKRTRTGN